MEKIIFKQLRTLEDFKKLQFEDKCLIKQDGIVIIREFKSMEFLGEQYGTWICFKGSQSSNFNLEEYIEGVSNITDVIYIQ